MSSPTDSERPAQAELDHARFYRDLYAEVRAGRLPTVSELMTGSPFAHGRLGRDAYLWSQALLAESDIDAELRKSLEVMAARVTPATIEIVRTSMEALLADDHGDLSEELVDGLTRLDIYYVACRSLDRRDALIAQLLSPIAPGDGNRRAAVAFGVRSLKFHHRDTIADMEQAYRTGSAILRRTADFLRRIERAEAVMDEPSRDDEVLRQLADLPDPVVDDAVADMLEDRAEFRMGGPGAHMVTVITVPDTKKMSSHQRDVAKAFADISGKSLPVVTGDPVAARISLALRFPHAIEAIDAVLRDLSTSPEVRLRPLLLVGSPGGGKTALARRIGEALGLYTTVYACAGQSDASFMGTSSQWSTARPSVPLDAVRASETANPLIVLDEIEKAGTSSHNGSLVNALLTFLERSHASAIRDLALEVNVDLSWVNYIATANSLSGIPDPLRDRFRIIEVPDPEWRHVGDLARSILDDIAGERRIDRRWIEDLAADELEVLHEVWPGGSIRKLRRALEVLVDGRDQLIGRA